MPSAEVLDIETDAFFLLGMEVSLPNLIDGERLRHFEARRPQSDLDGAARAILDPDPSGLPAAGTCPHQQQARESANAIHAARRHDPCPSNRTTSLLTPAWTTRDVTMRNDTPFDARTKQRAMSSASSAVPHFWS